MVTPLKVHGIDISHYQGGNLDLAGAKKRGLLWVVHKATEGDSWVDDHYARRREECRKAGLPFGAYHFARPERGDAVAEARRFLAIAKPRPGDIRPTLDLETDEGLTLSQLRTWADTWCDVVAKHTGAQPIIYTPFDLGFAQKGRIIWRPRYNNDNRPPALPYDIWQFSNGVYGVPNHLAGIGHVDLNVMRKGLTVADMRIPQEEKEPTKPPKKDSERVRFAHISMQFSDSPDQMASDAAKLFARFEKKGTKIITGTEAGPGSDPLPDLLAKEAKEHGFRFWLPSRPTDCWIAVRKDFVDGGWKKGYEPVIPGSSALKGATRRWGPKGVVSVEFDNARLGHIAVGAAHYLTGARAPGKAAQHGGVNHWEWNEKLGKAVGAWAKRAARGSALAFYGGDQNMADARNDQPQGDTFFGEPLTSAWDELEKWENTGHGPIDVIASYDRDGRVSARWVNALNDKEFHLHTDHFLVEAVYDIKVLNPKA